MAPTEALFEASEIAAAMLDDIPPVYREDPDIRAAIYAQAKETELRRAKLDEVRRQFFPLTADVALPAWEALFRVTVNPVGATLAERREIVGDAFLRALAAGTGADWEEALERLVGAGVAYTEFDPQVPSNVLPPHTLRVTVPFPPDSETFARIEAALQVFTPANTDIIVSSGTSFLLDLSHLDVDSFGGN